MAIQIVDLCVAGYTRIIDGRDEGTDNYWTLCYSGERPDAVLEAVQILQYRLGSIIQRSIILESFDREPDTGGANSFYYQLARCLLYMIH